MTKVVVATSNKGKLREIEMILHTHDVLPYTELIEAMEIIEDGKDFKENAIIKSETIFKALGDDEAIVIADDSGISVPILGHIPGIYSARYAGENATDKDNLHKLIEALKAQGISRTDAYYTSAIAITTLDGTFTTHGWMHGDVIDHARGENGFGYDPMFIPRGYDLTLGELEDGIKKEISHRGKSLALCALMFQALVG